MCSRFVSAFAAFLCPPTTPADIERREQSAQAVVKPLRRTLLWLSLALLIHVVAVCVLDREYAAHLSADNDALNVAPRSVNVSARVFFGVPASCHADTHDPAEVRLPNLRLPNLQLPSRRLPSIASRGAARFDPTGHGNGDDDDAIAVAAADPRQRFPFGQRLQDVDSEFDVLSVGRSLEGGRALRDRLVTAAAQPGHDSSSRVGTHTSRSSSTDSSIPSSSSSSSSKKTWSADATATVTLDELFGRWSSFVRGELCKDRRFRAEVDGTVADADAYGYDHQNSAVPRTASVARRIRVFVSRRRQRKQSRVSTRATRRSITAAAAGATAIVVVVIVVVNLSAEVSFRVRLRPSVAQPGLSRETLQPEGDREDTRQDDLGPRSQPRSHPQPRWMQHLFFGSTVPVSQLFLPLDGIQSVSERIRQSRPKGLFDGGSTCKRSSYTISDGVIVAPPGGVSVYYVGAGAVGDDRPLDLGAQCP